MEWLARMDLQRQQNRPTWRQASPSLLKRSHFISKPAANASSDGPEGQHRRKYLRSMFRFAKTLDVITLFHAEKVPSSLRVHTLLKQASAHASETATEDQAADHTHQNQLQRTEFELNITEEPPTSDQLRSILEYVGSRKASQLVHGARNEADALRLLKEDSSKFIRPVTVDWNNGRAVIGDSESEILKLVAQLPKETKQV